MSKDERKIKYIKLEDDIIFSNDDGEIKRFEKKGEMAYVEWFRKGNREFNGRYVSEVMFDREIK